MAQYSKRGRSNNRRRQGGNSNPNRSMDSQGPEVKIRGTATQIYDKYQALARDAASAGDRIRAESLMQHAEHYYRLMKSMQPPEKQADSKKDDSAETSENASEQSNQNDAAPEKNGDSSPKQEAAAEGDTEESSEDAKPRRRRRRRRPSDDDSDSQQNAESQGESAPTLEDAPAE